MPNQACGNARFARALTWGALLLGCVLLPAANLGAQAEVSVDGVIRSSVGGFRFPDGTLQATATADRAPVFRTGASTCFDEIGTERDCSGTGEDAEFQAGVAWPTPRFTDHGNGTVTDHLTGLIWMKDGLCLGEMGADWQVALDWIETLNTAPTACGEYVPLTYTDWRMPQIKELASLFDRTLRDKSLPDGHPFESLGLTYWSSTAVIADPDETWAARFLFGTTSDLDKVNEPFLNPGHAWPVREGRLETAPNGSPVSDSGVSSCFDTDGVPRACSGTGEDGEHQSGTAWPTPRFEDHGDGTVGDRLTGLTWLKDANCPNLEMTWQQALDWVASLNSTPVACSDYTAMTFTDWRLPNINEIMSLVDYSQASPALPPGHPFVNVDTAENYWSSTSGITTRAYQAWKIELGGLGHPLVPNVGPTILADKTDFQYSVWPVRGGL